jgi:hypothetical protein
MSSLAPEDVVWKRPTWVPPAMQFLRGPYQFGLSKAEVLSYFDGRDIFETKVQHEISTVCGAIGLTDDAAKGIKRRMR